MLRQSVTKNWTVIEEKNFPYIGKMLQICSDFVDICTHYMKTYDEKEKTHHLYYLNATTITKCEIELYRKYNNRYKVYS